MRSATRWSSGVAAALACLAWAGSATALGEGADGSFEQRTSSHFVLYQDVDIDQAGGFHGSRRFEQNVLQVLENAYESLDRLLGLRPNRKIDVVVYDPGIFDANFRGLFRFSAAGFYHGVIRVKGTTEVTPYLQHVLYHELMHAALDMAAPSLFYPVWLNEGLAEWFENRALGKRGLAAWEWQALKQARRGGGLFSYAQLAGSFAGLNQQAASIAYLQSYGMIDHLVRHHGERKLEQLVDSFMDTRNLDRTLRRVYRADLETLEQRFFAELM